MNNKKLIGASASTLAVLLVVITISSNSPNIVPYQEKFTPGMVPPPKPLSDILEGKSVPDIQSASNAIGHPIKHPKYLPKDYDIKRIALNGDKMVELISKFPITDQTTDQQFVWEQQGITVYLSTSANTPQEIKQVLKNESDRWQPVDINGLRAAGHDIIRVEQDGQVVSSQAELLFYNDKTRIYVTGIGSTTRTCQHSCKRC
jgi:hypothetical protein